MYTDLINGCRVVVVPPQQVRVKRSWKERLFSFTPWVSHKIEVHEVMGEEVITDVAARTMYMRLDTKLKLEAAIAAKKAGVPQQ